MELLPDHVKAYKRLNNFTQDSVPKGLLNAHTTKAGSWGKINIISGSLLYRILEPEIESFKLTPEFPGIVEPQIKHEVELIGDVEFFVEFYK